MNNIATHFSPKGGCEAEAVRVISLAKIEILVQAYSFTNLAIAHALIAAVQRGAKVRVIQDFKASTEHGAVLIQLKSNGIECWTDAVHSIAHNKIMIVDNTIVLTGSFNFTYQAEHSNAENLLTIEDPKIADIYKKNWLNHLEHSKPIQVALIKDDLQELSELTQT
jgi:phosphatidylserine/phosphatidylglycerophosphate/cardiolipin synthase-like enzyme